MKSIPQLAHELLVGRRRPENENLTSEAVAAYFLRTRCARTDLSHAVLANAGALDFWAQLERIRNELNGGRIDQAEKLINELDPQTSAEKAELLL